MRATPRLYDAGKGDVGVCQSCGNAIQWGQPYMPRIPFVAGWKGFSHQFCPPRLVVLTKQRRNTR